MFVPEPEFLARCNEATGAVIGSAIEVHRWCGNGLLESAYELCLCHELSLRGWEWERQVVRPINDKGLDIETAYRMDLVVAGSIVVELKTVDALTETHEAQLLTYLHFSNTYLGLLLNFREARMKDGIARIVNPKFSP